MPNLFLRWLVAERRLSSPQFPGTWLRDAVRTRPTWPTGRTDLELAVMDGRKNVKDFCFRLGISTVRVVGPWKELKDQGDQVWRDAVHLTDSGYNTIAATWCCSPTLSCPPSRRCPAQGLARDRERTISGEAVAAAGRPCFGSLRAECATKLWSELTAIHCEPFNAAVLFI